MWVEFNMILGSKILINSNSVTAVQSQQSSNPNKHRCYIYSDSGGEDNSFTVEHSYEEVIAMLGLDQKVMSQFGPGVTDG